MQASTKPTEAPAKRRKGRWLDRFAIGMGILSLAVICFIVGAFVVEFQVPFYKKVLQPSFVGLRAYHEKATADWMEEGWYRAREDKVGISKYRPDLADNGLTLYTSLGEVCSASLVSMQGDIVHEWKLAFRDAWPDSPHVPSPMPEKRIHWRHVRLFPNGDLLVDYTAIADTPNGYGLVKIDKDSHVIWRYADRAHHDFDVDQDGKVYCLTHCIRHDPVEAAPQLNAPMLEDFVVVLSKDGNEVERVSVFDAFANSKYHDFLQSIRPNKKGDHTHANTMHVVHEGFAKKHPFCSAGDVMISLREPDELAIINLERKEVVWAARGIWQQQHDADPLENGNVMVFDNRGSYGEGGHSRVLEWNPETEAIEWSYSGTEAKPFESLSRGCQEQLKNGNILITESNNGRIFEVTRDHRIVWEYLNPVRIGNEVAVVCSAQRFQANQLPFLNERQIAQANDTSVRIAERNMDSKVR
jgi:hypothetical protein